MSWQWRFLQYKCCIYFFNGIHPVVLFNSDLYIYRQTQQTFNNIINIFYIFRPLRVKINVSKYACKCFEICGISHIFILTILHCPLFSFFNFLKFIYIYIFIYLFIYLFILLTSYEIIGYLLARRWRDKLPRGGVTCTNRKMISLHFKNIYSDWSYKCVAREANVFETGKTPPCPSDVSLAATTPRQLQLCTMITK